MIRLLSVGLLLCPVLVFAAPAKKISVSSGQAFVLKKDQVALIKGTDASLRITGFINSPCPKGARCIWSGQAVNLELAVAGSTVALDGSCPFVVETLDSDYKTRAKLKVSKRALRK